MMTKSITTLVDDIQSVMAEGVPSDTVPFHVLAEYGTNVTKHFADTVLKKEPGTEKKRQFRQVYASEIGHPCIKNLVYKSVIYHDGGPHQEISGNDALKFMYGDWIEETVLTAAKIAGHKVEHQQMRLEWGTPGVGLISGRIDAIIDGVLVDVKSIQHQGFTRLGRVYSQAEDKFGYNHQLGFYRWQLIHEDLIDPDELPKFLFVSKQSGAMKLVEMDTSIALGSREYVEDRVTRLSTYGRDSIDMIPRIPAVPEGASGNLKLDTVCKYCPFKKDCYPGVRTFIYSTGPEYLVHVAKEPKVPEVKDPVPF